jgi:5-methylcytosine-specific restriction endonuclease McrA
MNSKPCTKCGVIKSLEEYSPDKRAKDGKQGRCRECSRIANNQRYHADVEMSRGQRRAYYSENKRNVLANNAKSRKKNRCKVLAGKKEYYERVKSDPEWQKTEKDRREKNKAKKREYDRAYAAENSARKVEAAKNWRDRNPERRAVIVQKYDARRRNWKADCDQVADIAKWREDADKACHWCGVDCSADFHVDHVIPLSKGGSHTLDNLVISCPTCNLRKGAKDPEQFKAEMVQ